MFRVPNRYRVLDGPFPSKSSYGNNGLFEISIGTNLYTIVASDGLNWEHVSVSKIVAKGRPNQCPTWEDMCIIKNRFWSKDQTVLQYHPSEKEYVNIHPGTLHLWRPMKEEIPKPPKWMV